MKQPPLMKSGRMVVVALAALVPLAVAAQTYDRDPTYRSSGSDSMRQQQYEQDQAVRGGAQGQMRSDIDSATPTYSGEDRRQYQSETPGAQGPVRSDMEGSQTYGSEGSLNRQDMQQQHDRMHGAEGPMRSEGQSMVDRQRSSLACSNTGSEYTSPNAYYGESNPFYSEQGKAAFFGRGQYCAR